MIFGKLGFPKLGVTGAAIATVISRYVELFIVVAWTHVKKERNLFAVGPVQEHVHTGQDCKKCHNKRLAAFGERGHFGVLPMAAIVQGYSTRGLEVVGAQNISTVVSNLFNVVFQSMGVALSIIVGQALGSGDTKKAIELDRKLITVSVLSGVATGVLLAAIAPFLPVSIQHRASR